MGKHSYLPTKSVLAGPYIQALECSTVEYSYIRTKLQGPTLVFFSPSMDLSVLANNRKAGSSDTCDY